MKRGAPRCKKMRALANLLKVPLPHAVGMMEMIWHYAGYQTPQGDIGIASDREIAAAVDWEKKPSLLIDALVEARWLDRDSKHRLIIHDWPDHADNAVKKLLMRMGKGFLDVYAEDNHSQPAREAVTVPTIYFVQASETKWIKIGFTEGPVASRITALQDGCPETITELVSFPGSRHQEKLLHEQFANSRKRGEWFEPSNEILAFIEDKRQAFGGISAAEKLTFAPRSADESPPTREARLGVFKLTNPGNAEQTSTPLESAIERISQDIYDRHPDVRRCGIKEIRDKLHSIVRDLPRSEKIPKLQKINANHAEWCHSEAWSKDGGEFAKGLDNWLAPTKGRYDVAPPKPPESGSRVPDWPPPGWTKGGQG